jgi:monoamine oxidase
MDASHRLTRCACAAGAGFIAGERADALKDVPAAEAVGRFLDQLDTIFGTPSDPKPATASYVRSLVFDWSKEPYVGAAYTYPTLGAHLGDRAAAGAPVLGTLFFAGEACHTGVNPCMQAALETGEQAAAQVAAALQPVQSRL